MVTLGRRPAAYYNDSDPFVVEWLAGLIAAGEIMQGDVDGRPIEEVEAADVAGYSRAHWFAGVGGWDLALRLAGWPDDRPVWTGSCPCQPFSVAGRRRGADDARHIWPAWARLIRECRPGVVFGEQVPGALGHGWLDGVFADLEGEGYAVGAVVLGAHSVGAPHIRQRIWWVADSSAERWRARTPGERAARTEPAQPERSGRGLGDTSRRSLPRESRAGGRSEGEARGSGGRVVNADGARPCSRVEGAARARHGRPALPAGGRLADTSSGGGRADGERHGAREADPDGRRADGGPAGRARGAGRGPGGDRAEARGGARELADATGLGRSQGRADPERRGGGGATAPLGARSPDDGGARRLADSRRGAGERSGVGRELGGAPGEAAGEGLQRERRGPAAVGGGEVGRLADTEGRTGGSGHDVSGREPDPGEGGRLGHAEGAGLSERAGAASSGPDGGEPWERSEPTSCADGRVRRIGAGVLPLAHGLPRSVARLGAKRRRLAALAGLDGSSLRRAKTYRVGTLRGLGNAIVAQTGAVFIRAWMDEDEGGNA